jgi:CHAT domain-containing protein
VFLLGALAISRPVDVDAQLALALKSLDKPADSLAIATTLDASYGSMTKAQKAQLDYIFVEALVQSPPKDDLVSHLKRLASNSEDLSIPGARSKALLDAEKATDKVLDDKVRVGMATSFIEALDSSKDAQEDLGTALFVRAGIYQKDILQIPQAVNDLKRAEDIARQTHSDGLLLECDNLHADLCTPTGDYTTTKMLGEEMLSILGKDSNPDFERLYHARAESALGRASHYLGDLAAAAEHHQRALDLAKKTLDLRTIQESAQGLVLVLANERLFSEADKKITEFLQLAKFLPNSVPIQERLLIAQVYLQWRRGQYADAKKTSETLLALDAALAAAARDPYVTMLAKGCHALATIYLGQPHEVIDEAKEVDDWFKLWGDKSKDSIVASALYFRGLVGDHQYAKALDAGNDLIARFEHVIDQVTDPADTGYYQQTLPHPYGHMAWLEHLIASEAEPARAESSNETALTYSERGRGRGLQRQQVANLSNVYNHFTSAEQKSLADEQAKLNLAYYSLHQAEADTTGNPVQHEAKVAALQLKAADEDQTRKDLLDKVLVVHGDARLELLKSQAEWSEITRKSLVRNHPDTLYLSYSLIDEDRSLLIVTGQDLGVRSFELPIGEGGWIDRAKTWLNDIKSDGGAQEEAGSAAEAKQAASLYTDLMAQLESAHILGPKFQKIVIVADGAIATLPFSALINSQGKRLAEQYAISYAESLCLLTLGDTTDPPTKTLLCLADPNGNLPTGKQEGETITGLFRNKKLPDLNLLQGNQATATEAKKDMPDYAIVHFACDGYLNSFNSSGNGLVLSSAQGQGDGVLSGSEIMWMPMRAGLIVLSACETAVNEFNGGDGIQGLAWAFQAANCPTVIASRWKVNDDATGDLMVKFYEKLLTAPPAGKKETSVAEALQEAEVALIESKTRRSKPYYWAAFDVFGKGEMTQASLRFPG